MPVFTHSGTFNNLIRFNSAVENLSLVAAGSLHSPHALTPISGNQIIPVADIQPQSLEVVMDRHDEDFYYVRVSISNYSPLGNRYERIVLLPLAKRYLDSDDTQHAPGTAELANRHCNDGNYDFKVSDVLNLALIDILA